MQLVVEFEKTVPPCRTLRDKMHFSFQALWLCYLTWYNIAEELNFFFKKATQQKPSVHSQNCVHSKKTLKNKCLAKEMTWKQEVSGFKEKSKGYIRGMTETSQEVQIHMMVVLMILYVANQTALANHQSHYTKQSKRWKFTSLPAPNNLYKFSHLTIWQNGFVMYST